MALTFMDGFDHYLTKNMTKKWSSASLNTSGIYPTAGRRGGGAYMFANSDEVVKNFTAVSTVILGAALSFEGMYASVLSSTGVVRFKDSGTTHVSIHPQSDGSLKVYRGDNTALLGSTDVSVVNTSGYQYIEMKVTISDTVGAVELRVNGVSVLTLTDVDTQNGGNASVNGIRIGGSLGTNVKGYVDDLYICDTSGTENNDFLGDIRIDVLKPGGSGTHNGFTPTIVAADETTSYTYWRILAKSWISPSTQYLYEIEMRATVGGADQCSGGTATSSGGTAANGFDDNLNTFVGFGSYQEHWLKYQFASPVSVRELAVYSGAVGDSYSPVEFWIQASDDDTNWTTLGEFRLVSPAKSTWYYFTLPDGNDYSLVAEQYALDYNALYLTGGAAGSKETFTLTPTTELPTQNLVVAVQVNNYAYKSDAGGAMVRNLVRSGTSEAVGADTALSTDSIYIRSIHEINPATGQPWLLTEAQAMEAGLEVVA